MKLNFKGKFYTISHKKTTPATRAAFGAAMKNLPADHEKELSGKMLNMVAADAGLIESTANMTPHEQAAAIMLHGLRTGKISIEEVIKFRDGRTVDEIIAEDRATVELFKAVADTSGLPDGLVKLIESEFESEFYQNIDIKEVKAFIAGFRL